MEEDAISQKSTKKGGITLPTTAIDGEIKKKSAIAKFDDLMSSMGRYEVCTCFFLTLMYFPYAWHVFSFVFFTVPYEFECVPNTIDKCDPSCRKIHFPNTRNVTNIISEWKLVCENEYKQVLPRLMLIIGAMLGCVLFGHWADQHGRRLSILYTCYIMLVGGLMSGASPWLWLYCISEFFVGLSMGGWIVCFMVFLVEYVSPQYREFIILSMELEFFVGFCILPAIAYFLPNWRHIQLLTSGLGVFCVAYNWLLPESPRWLLLTGRIEQCAKILQTSSRNTKLSRQSIIRIICAASKELRKGVFAKTGGIGYIFVVKEIRKKVCLLGFLWFCIYLTAYGLPYYPTAFGGNIYINVALNASFSAVASIIAFPLNKFLKHRTIHAATLCLAALFMYSERFVTHSNDHAYVQTIFSMSTALLAISRTNLFIYTIEVYPTFLRNSAMGFGFFCAQTGVLIAVLTTPLRYSNHNSVVLLLASLSILAAALLFLLPESKISKMIDNFEED